MIILDTNVLSEVFRPKPDDRVTHWMRAQPAITLFTTSICEAEIFYGIAVLPASKRRTSLQAMAHGLFGEDLAGRVLPFDGAAARAFAEIAAARRQTGRPIGEFDAQIAAIGRAHGATLATRNLNDFGDCGIEVFSPWEA
jgi:toxin FitB